MISGSDNGDLPLRAEVPFVRESAAAATWPPLPLSATSFPGNTVLTVMNISAQPEAVLVSLDINGATNPRCPAGVDSSSAQVSRWRANGKARSRFPQLRPTATTPLWWPHRWATSRGSAIARWSGSSRPADFSLIVKPPGVTKSGYNPSTRRYTTVPNHPGDLPEGTLRAILKTGRGRPGDLSPGLTWIGNRGARSRHNAPRGHPQNRRLAHGGTDHGRSLWLKSASAAPVSGERVLAMDACDQSFVHRCATAHSTLSLIGGLCVSI